MAAPGAVQGPHGLCEGPAHVERLEDGTEVKLGVFPSNGKSRRAKLTADKLAALGLEWAAFRNNGGARPGDVARGGRRRCQPQTGACRIVISGQQFSSCEEREVRFLRWQRGVGRRGGRVLRGCGLAGVSVPVSGEGGEERGGGQGVCRGGGVFVQQAGDVLRSVSGEDELGARETASMRARGRRRARPRRRARGSGRPRRRGVGRLLRCPRVAGRTSSPNSQENKGIWP